MSGGTALAAARQMSGALVDRSAAIEAAGRLPDEVVDQLRASGIPGLWLPMELGGAEADPAEVVDAIATNTDVSAAWAEALALLADVSDVAREVEAALTTREVSA